MSKLADCVVGLGANLGDRLAAMLAAIEALSAFARIEAISELYASAPLGPPQPDFLNAALRLHTHLGPSALLDELLAIERSQGRIRRVRWGPRTLDLDILWVSGLVVDEPHLTVPHPELDKRAFAILPLLDVAPMAADPRTGIAYRDMLPDVDAASVRRVSEPRWPTGSHD